MRVASAPLKNFGIKLNGHKVVKSTLYPIYKNSPYADSFVIIQILDGTLGPAQ
jgi:hypothetical protein